MSCGFPSSLRVGVSGFYARVSRIVIARGECILVHRATVLLLVTHLAERVADRTIVVFFRRGSECAERIAGFEEDTAAHSIATFGIAIIVVEQPSARVEGEVVVRMSLRLVRKFFTKVHQHNCVLRMTEVVYVSFR